MRDATIDDGARLRFENAWKAGQPLPIETFIENVPPPERAQTLEQLVHSEIGLSWRAGRGTTVESYLGRFPELAEDPGRVRRIVYQEAWARHRFADSPPVDSYRGRFPELFDDEAYAAELAKLAASADAEAGPLGRYRIDSELGRGGFGTVWAARDPQLGRVVALKQLHAHVATRDDTRRRFIEEARVAARLEHPGVVPVYELGEADGAPYFAMKLVRGETLADAIVAVHGIDGAKADRDAVAAARLVEAFLAVARTMAFAHERGVIHRDLKPQNVILGNWGETVILDWGLAKSLDEREAARRRAAENPGAGDSSDSGITQAGAVLGTPAYMAPEQARGEISQLDRKSDVFSLGAMLYEVLTGRLPFSSISAVDMMGDIASPRPVTLRPRQIDPRIPRALEAICLKALEKDRAKRYPDAGAMAADLARHLAGAPVSAHRETLPERLLRWARHRRGLVLTIALALVVLMAGAIVTAIIIEGERAQVARSEVAAREAEQRAENERREAVLARDAAVQQTYVASVALALRAWEDGDLNESERRLAGTPEARRGWEYRYARGLSATAEVEIAEAEARKVAVSPDGDFVAVAGVEPRVTIYRHTDQERTKPLGPIVVVTLEAPPDELVLTGERLAVLSRGEVSLFSWSAGGARREGTWANVQGVVRDRGGRIGRVEAPNQLLIATEHGDITVRLHSATPNGSDEPEAPVEVVALAPDGERAVTVDLAQRARMTELDSGALLWDVPLPDLASPQLAFGAVVAVAQDRRFGGRLARLDPQSGQELLPAVDFERPVTALAADPGRDRIVAGTIDGALHVIDSGLETNLIRAHRSPVRDVAFAGRDIVSAAADGVRFWDPQRPQAMVVGSGHALAFAPDGRWVDGQGVTYDRWTGALVGEATPISAAEFAEAMAIAGPDGDTLVMRFRKGLWIGSRSKRALVNVGDADLFALAANSRVAAYARGAITLWDLATRSAIGPPTPVGADGIPLALVATGQDSFRVVRGGVGDVAVASADGAMFASAHAKGPVRIEDASGKVIGELAGPFEDVTALGFTVEGDRVVVADGLRVGLWDVMRGSEVLSLAMPERVKAIAASPDGRSLGFALVDGRVLVFNASWPRP